MPPIREVRELTAAAMFEVDGAAGPQAFTFDFGVEIAGWVRLTVPPGTPAGTNFTLYHAEVLSHPPIAPSYDGSAFMGNLFWANPVDIYLSRGDPSGETYTPRFTQHGFRFVELHVDPPLPLGAVHRTTLVAAQLQTDVRDGGKVTIGNPMLQGIYDLSRNTEAAALMSIPAGATGRGERGAWTGDASIASESECFDFFTGAFFTEYLEQIRDGSCADGTMGNAVPQTDPRRDGPLPVGPNCSMQTKDLSWSSVYPTVLHNVWKYYGAVGVLRDHWRPLPGDGRGIRRYMEFIDSEHAKTGMKSILCTWGDHQQLTHTSCHLTAAGEYVVNQLQLAEIATALGETEAAAAFNAAATAGRAEFHQTFWDPTARHYGTGTQLDAAMALWIGAVPADSMQQVADDLAQAVADQGLTFGFLGVRYVFEALAKVGRIDGALRCLLRRGYPGYGYTMYNAYEPSTTVWESWDAPTMHQWLDESSRAHHFMTGISTFLRKYVVGLDMPEGTAGWEVVRVRPEAAAPLNDSALEAAVPWAATAIETARGRVAVSWAREPTGSVSLNCSIPLGSTGEVHLPKHGGDGTIRENGTQVWSNGKITPAAAAQGITSATDGLRFVIFDVQSGVYSFSG